MRLFGTEHGVRSDAQVGVLASKYEFSCYTIHVERGTRTRHDVKTFVFFTADDHVFFSRTRRTRGRPTPRVFVRIADVTGRACDDESQNGWVRPFRRRVAVTPVISITDTHTLTCTRVISVFYRREGGWGKKKTPGHFGRWRYGPSSFFPCRHDCRAPHPPLDPVGRYGRRARTVFDDECPSRVVNNYKPAVYRGLIYACGSRRV